MTSLTKDELLAVAKDATDALIKLVRVHMAVGHNKEQMDIIMVQAAMAKILNEQSNKMNDKDQASFTWAAKQLILIPVTHTKSLVRDLTAYKQQILNKIN